MAQHDVKTMSKWQNMALYLPQLSLDSDQNKTINFFEKLLLMDTNESYGNYITSYPSDSNEANRLGETAKTINKTQFN